MDYSAYLTSDHWRSLREKILARAGGVCECEGCNRRATQVHHKTYERLGEEHPEDLLAVCFPCHQEKHPEKTLGISSFRSVPCPRCGQCLADKHGLKQHLRDVHEDHSGEQVCPSCGPRMFVAGLVQHLKKKHGFPAHLSDKTIIDAAQHLPWVSTQPATADFLGTYGENWPPEKGWKPRIALKVSNGCGG